MATRDQICSDLIDLAAWIKVEAEVLKKNRKRSMATCLDFIAEQIKDMQDRV
jgi:hypothetical protein